MTFSHIFSDLVFLREWLFKNFFPIAVFTISLSAVIFYGILLLQGRARWLWGKKNAPTWPLPILSFLAYTLLLVLITRVIPSLLPAMGVAVPVVFLLAEGRLPFTFWNVQLRNIGDYLLTALQILPVIILPLYLLTGLSMLTYQFVGWDIEAQPAIAYLKEAWDQGWLGSFIIQAVILAPIWEEVVFRGVAYPVLKSRIHPRLAQWISAIIFAAIHGHGPTFIPLTCFGYILVSLYEETGSLGYNVILHSLFNLNSILLLIGIFGL